MVKPHRVERALNKIDEMVMVCERVIVPGHVANRIDKNATPQITVCRRDRETNGQTSDRYITLSAMVAD